MARNAGHCTKKSHTKIIMVKEGAEMGALCSESERPRIAGDHSELAGEIGFSYQMPISQPAEILTI
jgi:hypothetical protein